MADKLDKDIKVKGDKKLITPKKQIRPADYYDSTPPDTTGPVERIDDFSPGTAREIAQAAQDEEDGRERPAKRARREGEGGRRRKGRGTMRRKSRKHRKTQKKRKF